VPGAFDYRSFLRCAGIRHLFEASSVTAVEPARGWRLIPASLYAFRDLCAGALVSDVENPANVRVLLAMTLGCRRSLDAETRRRFLRSGAIHIFAVSGLHVGIIAALMLFCLRAVRIPVRMRWLSLPVVLALYVFITGAAPSAVRAWLMLTLWSLSRAAAKATVPLNTVAVAALVLVALNPFSLAQPGFQFSFTIVTVLVLGWRSLSRLTAIAWERRQWIPARLRSHTCAQRVGRRLLQLLGGTLLAWFASAGLIAWTNQLLIPAGLPVNVGISVLAWLALMLAFPKMLAAGLTLTAANSALAGGVDLVLSGMQALAELGSRSPGSVAVVRPAWWLVLAYYALLIAALLPCFRARWRILFATALCGLLAAVVFTRPRAVAGVVVHGGRSALPAVALTGGRGAAPVVVNTGGPDTGRALAAWLGVNGYDSIECLILSSEGWNACAGSRRVMDAARIRCLVSPADPPRQEYVQNAVLRQWASGTRTRVLLPDADGKGRRLETPALRFSASREGDVRRMVLQRALPGASIQLDMSVTPQGITRIECRRNGRTVGELQVCPTYRVQVSELTAGASEPD
jgi:ComEC/Rec2-related protein